MSSERSQLPPIDNSDVNNENGSIDARRSQVKAAFAELKKRTRESVGTTDGAEPTYASLHTVVPFRELPESVKKLTAIADAPEDGQARITFGHFNAYENFKPAYSITMAWDKPKASVGSAIDTVHFNIKEDGAGVIDQFFPLDSTSAFRSDVHFPYPIELPISDIPKADRTAMNQYRTMSALVTDKEFELELLEDLTSIFNR